MKTNKSFTKRLRVTKNGKVLARKAGGNHFNAKEGRTKQLKRRKTSSLTLSKSTKKRFISN